MQLLPLVQTDFHHSIQILFDKKNWILYALHNQSSIKNNYFCSDLWMHHGIICHSYVFQEYAHVENKMPVFEFMECSIFHEILILRFKLKQYPFVCMLFQVSQKLYEWNI